MKGGFVSEPEAGQRLFQVAHDPRCKKSGVYWSWNGGPREGRGMKALEQGGQISGGGGAGGGWDSIFENDQSAKVLDVDTAVKLFDYSTKITGAEWPSLKAITSPCPTLKVIGAVTKAMVEREELRRMQEMGRPGLTAEGLVLESTTPVEAVKEASLLEQVEKPTTISTSTPKRRLTKRKRVAMAVDRIATAVLSNTVGRVARVLGKRVLGEIPETAKTGSFHPPAVGAPARVVETSSNVLADLEDAQKLLDEEVAQQLKSDKDAVVEDKEDEALFTKIYTESTGRSVPVVKPVANETSSQQTFIQA